MRSSPVRTDVVLVGGGHTHVQILRRWIMRPVDGVRLTVVLDRPEAVYSGMVPGFVAGDYATHELELDVVPLARRAGARVVLAAATAIDPQARRVHVDGRAPIAWDVASLDVGATVRGHDLPGVREHALATRPIRSLVDRVVTRVEEVARAGTVRVVIVGAGAAGVELACTLRARLRTLGARPEIEVVSEEADILPGYPRRVARRMRHELALRGIAVRERTRAVGVARDALVLETGSVPADLVVWATGAAPLPFLADAPLPRDTDGFLRVRPTLQVEGHDDLFAAGDCASIPIAPWVRKAGVYAVREGPVLDANLRARLAGTSLRRYRPQRDFLSLLNLGERRALAAKWGLVAAGGWVWRWKDRIDRRFVERFTVLAPDGAPAPAFDVPAMPEDEQAEMACGGCAAKVDAAGLTAALARLPAAPHDPSVIVGLTMPDDAAAVDLGRGGVLVATVDGFRAFTDDPWLVGAVAAVNAMSDVFAKGGRPRHALALLTVAEEQPARAEEALFQVLAGARSALDPRGVTLVGGHSASGPELFASLTVTGELAAGEALLPLGGAEPGDALVLTKPLGTGVILAADMRGRCRGGWLAGALASMLRANDAAARVAREFGAHACTDVSGFGLAGHLSGMLRRSGVSARLDLAALPALVGARALFALGVRSTAHAINARVKQFILVPIGRADDPRVELLYDPQTSGGLLMALPPVRAEAAVRALREGGDEAAAVVGTVEEPRSDGPLIEIG